MTSRTFHGAAGCVTGSRFLVAGPTSRVPVDTDLFRRIRRIP